MGYNVVRLEVSARLSSHHTNQDIKDKMEWEHLIAEIEKLRQHPRYRDIQVRMMEVA